MARQLHPAPGLVLARRNLEATGKLVVPDKARIKLDEATVVRVGSPVRLDNIELSVLECKPGDVIAVAARSGDDIKLDGEEFVVFRHEEILGVITSE